MTVGMAGAVFTAAVADQQPEVVFYLILFNLYFFFFGLLPYCVLANSGYNFHNNYNFLQIVSLIVVQSSFEVSTLLQFTTNKLQKDLCNTVFFVFFV